MVLTNSSTLRQLCRQYGITPDKNSGQHFLISREPLERAVVAADLAPQDTVLEVGPGFGTLTVELARRAGRVIAVELDPKLCAAAKEILAPCKNVELVAGNFLNLPLTTYHLPPGYKLVANLPYNITGRFFRKVLTASFGPRRIVVMVQQEVAERVTANPGDLSVVAVQCQLYAQVKIVASVPRENFWPQPEVDSAVVALQVRTAAELEEMMGDPAVSPEMVMRWVKVGFAARRKTLANNLRAVLGAKVDRTAGNNSSDNVTEELITKTLTSLGLLEKCRAQELSVKQWITLAKILKI
ncbi:MAG: 16S rRNA (adenine(1518)-N(6)/adenine(1519)-N(6))-dimethyltransferase RsmA [Patescibacteria group bacterium]|nr:16S rRNA (adenine(1518)-N(6)/adenine(1519)-N(6))-dimethyltransferase RsmA [Patescibacteria group bacterium]